MIAPRGRRLDGKLVDVGAGDEGLVARPGHDEHANLLVRLHLQDRSPQLIERRGVQRVEDLWPVDRDDDNGPITLDQEVLEGHERL